jgi:hypothetical protein
LRSGMSSCSLIIASRMDVADQDFPHAVRRPSGPNARSIPRSTNEFAIVMVLLDIQFPFWSGVATSPTSIIQPTVTTLDYR